MKAATKRPLVFKPVLTVAMLAASLTGCEQPKQPEAPQPKGAAVMTTFSSEELAQRTIERRAIEAVIWGMPAVNFDRMYQAMVHDAKAGEGSNKVVLLVSSLELEEPDSHAQPGHHLPDAFLQHQGRGAGGAGDSACRLRARSLAQWTTAGRRPSRTSDLQGSTRARAASTSSCHPATKSTFPPDTFPCHPQPTRAMHSFVPT